MMIGTRRTVGLVDLVGIISLCHSVQAHEASVQHRHMGMCPTGDPRTIMINQKTGLWKLLEDYYDDDFLANYLESKAHPTNSSSGFDDELNHDHDENEISVRRRLRKGFESIFLPDEDPLLFANPESDDNTAHEIHRLLSTDGSNSLATELSASGNVDDEDGGNVLFARVRPCACSHHKDDVVALCPETSGWCGMSSTNSTVSARCFYESKMSVVARNTWPLLWMWYIFIGFSVCCTFNGRIVLDFVKGTILYTICGFGDPFQNFNARNVNRYNDSIVNEIIREEREDREDVRRRRNDGSIVSRQMDAIANRTTSDTDGDQQGVPPTIVTSPSFPMGDYGDDSSHEDGDETTEVARPSPMEWLLERFRNVVWPWQTSWKRYIKYNLLLRVEWITLRDEVAFIESRQERGLPHARYEMRTRTWTAEDAGAACSCVGSIGPSVQSVDVPHCTICFSELEEGDIVGDLGCSHVFHADCLKMWVTKRNSCPLCNIPIARRKRISSEELVKENTTNDNADEDSFVAAANPATNDVDSFDYDHTLPPYSATTTTGYLSTPSHHQRRGPRRLSHMPTTPSTVAEDTYSNFSDDLDLDNVGSGGGSPSPSNSLPTPMDREESLVSTPPTSQRVDEVVDDTVDASSDNPARALSLDRCNIVDFLSRSGGDTQESALDHAENDGSGLAIPSPPRRIRRIADGNNEPSRSAGVGYDYGYSAAFAPTTEDGHDGTTQRYGFEQRTPKPADETAPLQCRKSNPEQDEDPNCEQQQQQQNLGADRHCCSGDDDDPSPQQQPQNLGADHHSSSREDDDDLLQVLNDTTKPSFSSSVSDEIPREQQHSEVDR